MSVTIQDLRTWKTEGRRFPMLTAYDYPTARILDEAGIPVLLVGDTLAEVVLGYETTLPVTMDAMVHHCQAVTRGARNALVVGDLPFLSYQTSVEDGIRNAGRFLKEAGAAAVKFEGPLADLANALTTRGIPVMGHLGLTPQSVHAMGGYRVQGRTENAALRLLDHAAELEDAGVFALVLEGVPMDLAREITEKLSIPTIGIGAGPHCDGQVLVINDLLGLSDRTPPKFVKRYADVRGQILQAVGEFKREVEDGVFPDEDHSYH
ncbi:MAG: 3-methyl-2-oxobutanoate hydroxymethyltransferase [Actinomycetota bacterium]